MPLVYAVDGWVLFLSIHPLLFVLVQIIRDSLSLALLFAVIIFNIFQFFYLVIIEGIKWGYEVHEVCFLNIKRKERGGGEVLIPVSVTSPTNTFVIPLITIDMV